MFWIPLLAGAAIGAAKHAGDVANYKQQAKIAASTNKFSPWTGQSAEMPNKPNPMANLIQGAATGLMFGQGLEGAGLLGKTASTGGSLVGGTQAMGGLGSGLNMTAKPLMSRWM